MPYAEHQGVRIHYQIEGEGPALVLHHGFSGSSENWYDAGYVATLQQDYRVLVLDARGHGASDKPHDPAAYELEQRVGDVVAVLDHEQITRAHYYGYSMGGWVGYGVAQYAPERFHSLIIGGSHPYARSMEFQRQHMRQGIEDGIEAFVAGMEKTYGPMPPKRKAQMLANDLKALLAAAQDRPNLEAVLPTMQMPCLLFVGEADGVYSDVKTCVEQIPNATFFSLPGLNHAETMRRSDLVLPHVTAFLKAVSQSTRTTG
jgi:pimeloyl-ACP methyl ester carboxylesterase